MCAFCRLRDQQQPSAMPNPLLELGVAGEWDCREAPPPGAAHEYSTLCAFGGPCNVYVVTRSSMSLLRLPVVSVSIIPLRGVKESCGCAFGEIIIVCKGLRRQERNSNGYMQP